MIIEIYFAVRGVIMGFLDKDVKMKAIPSITFTVDKVKSKVSGDNFLGIRIFFMDAGGVTRCFNLSIKQRRCEQGKSFYFT